LVTKKAYPIILVVLLGMGAFFLFRPNSQAEQSLTIASASDLKFAMDEIAGQFRKEHPGAKVDVIFASSGKLHTQIQQGAPYDIFFSADLKYAQSLRSSGDAVTEPKLYAIGNIVMWSATRDATALTLASLTDPTIKKIAIANPEHAPYGRRAEEALRSAGIWDQIESKLVFAENVSQAAQFASTGAADVGIISLSHATNDELASKGGYWLIPASLHTPLEQAYVVTKHGESNELATEFAALFETSESRAILARHGLAPPGQ
jgi:molybdate transport system substrate-binding protein